MHELMSTVSGFLLQYFWLAMFTFMTIICGEITKMICRPRWVKG